MDILKLELSNFMSHQDTSIPFSGLSPLTLILGSNNDRPHDSNGAGKSSIFEAVAWCLFGETIREISASNLIRHGQPSCSVHMVVSVDGAHYKITRTKKSGDAGSSEFVVEYDKVWGGSIAEKQQRMNQVLGMDFSLFRNTYLFGQDEGSEFLSATDKGRKEFICRLLGAGVLEVAKKKASDEALASSKTHEAAKARVRATEIQLTGMDVEDKVDTGALKVEADGLRTQREKLVAKLDPTLAKRKSVLLQDKTTADRKLVQSVSQLKGLAEDAKDDSVSVEAAQAATDVLDSASARVLVQKHSTAHQMYKQQVVEARERVKKIEAVDQCPWCMSILVGEAKAALVGRLAEERDLLEAKMGKAVDQKTLYTQVVAYREALEAKKQIEAAEASVRELTATRDTVVSQLDEIEESAALQEDLASRLAESDRKISGIETAIGRVEAQREMREKLEVALESAKADLTNKEHDSLVWATLSEAFGQHGLRSLLLDRAIPLIEAETNGYLRELSSKSVSIELDSKVETKSGSVQDKLDIRVIVGQEKQMLNACSGGEKRRVVLALRLALAKILRLSRGERAKSTSLFVDEASDDLDEDGLQRFIKLLKDSNEIFSRVLVVSHDQRLHSMVGGESVLWVENKAGVSRVKVGT